MEKERVWTLLARKVSNEASEEELKELEELLKQNPQLGVLVEKFLSCWHAGEQTTVPDARDKKTVGGDFGKNRKEGTAPPIPWWEMTLTLSRNPLKQNMPTQ